MKEWNVGPEHLARVHAKQYALIDHLRTNSELETHKAAKRAGKIESLSAVFILNLIETVL